MSEEKLEETIEDLCINLSISKSQRSNEVSRGKGLLGTMGYELAGCYDNCKGYNKDCQFYLSNFEAFGEDKEEYLK